MCRLLAFGLQNRLNSLLSGQDSNQEENSHLHNQDDVIGDLSDYFDLIEGARGDNNFFDIAGAPIENRSVLTSLRSMLQQMNDNADHEDDDSESEDNSSVRDDEDGGEDMEDDDDGGEDQIHSGEEEYYSDLGDFSSVAEEESYEHDSVMTDNVDGTITSDQRAVDQPRTVSMSSDDL